MRQLIWVCTVCLGPLYGFPDLPYVSSGVTYVDETALRTTLESGYKQSVRPSTPTFVDMFYTLRTLKSLDITNQAMTTVGWLSMTWDDPRLIWNSTDYANITEIDTDFIWRPELLSSNSVGEFVYGGFVNDEVRFRVFNTGRVRWILPIPLTTSCDVNIATFPFDSQSCNIELFFMGLNQIDVEPNITTQVMKGSYIPNAEWQYEGGYISTDMLPLCCPTSNFTWIRINLDFTRLRPFYIINLIVPSLLFSVCMVLAFLLPTDSGERLGYSLTILLSYTVLLTITTDMLPTTSKQTPVISEYLLALLVLCSLCVLQVVVHVKMFHLTTTPPNWLQKFGIKLEQIIFLRCRKRTDKVSSTEWSVKVEGRDNFNIACEKDQTAFDKESKSDTEEPVKMTWQTFADVLDRLCLYLYSIANLILLIGFFIRINAGY